jgi:hypothetical protein
MLEDLKHNLTDYNQFVNWFKSYANTDISTAEPWTIREALSYWIKTPKYQTIKHISKNILANSPYTWNQLNLLDQALLIRKLRYHGYEVESVNVLPTSVQEFHKLLKKISLKEQLKNKWHDWNIYGCIYDVFDNYLCLTTIVIGLIYYNNFTLLLAGLAVTWILWALTEVIKHEYLEHRYVVPKNTIIRYLSDLILYAVTPKIYLDKAQAVREHNYHHLYWKSERDEFIKKVRSALIPGLDDPMFLNRPTAENLNKLLAEHQQGKFLIKYLVELRVLFAVGFVAVFGLEYFIFLVLLPVILKTVMEYQHDLYIDRFGEKDYWWTWPLSLNQAWHLEHHRTFKRKPVSWDEIFRGPRLLKYLNPQYYFLRLLFRLKSTSLSS